MSIEVLLETRARFGKQDATSDYCWLMGKALLPVDLVLACEALSHLKSILQSYFSLVAEFDGALWLARTYTQGVDNTYRPIAAVEAAIVINPQSLSREDQLGLAATSVQASERERISTHDRFAICVPPPKGSPGLPDEEMLLRLRLGLPVSASTRLALAAVTHPPWRYRGICFALTANPQVAPSIAPELGGYFFVNFGEPCLSDDQRSVLDAARARHISETEWSALHKMETEQAQEVIRWSANPTAGSPFAPQDDALLDWLLAFRKTSFQGADLIRTLRWDLGSLPPRLLCAVMPDLSADALRFLTCQEGDDQQAVSASIVVELARHGLLAGPELVPLPLWAKFSSESPHVSQQAAIRLEEMGIPQVIIKFMLDLDMKGELPGSYAAGDLEKSLRIAAGSGLPVPRKNIMELIRSRHCFDYLWLLEVLNNGDSSWLAEVVAALTTGDLPPRGLLRADEMLAIASARESARKWVGGPLDLLSSLLQSQRIDEAIAVFDLARKPGKLGLRQSGMAILAAHLKQGPAVPIRQLGELRALVGKGLADPEDVLPDESDDLLIADCARLWKRTAAFAEIIKPGMASGMEVTLDYPQNWKVPLRRALTAQRLRRWLQRLGPDQFQQARRLIADLHGIDLKAIDAFIKGEAIQQEDGGLQHALPWLDVLLLQTTNSERLECLAHAARSGIFAGNEATAEAVTRSLLKGYDQNVIDLAVNALSAVGPLPAIDGVPAGIVIAFSHAIDTLALVDRLFTCKDTALSSDEQLVQHILELVIEKGVVCPSRGYTTKQRQLHVLLASRLSCAKGWESLAQSLADRAFHVARIMRQLDVRLEDLEATGRHQAPTPYDGGSTAQEDPV